MNRLGKWFDFVSPEEPITEIAAIALEQRFATVWRFARRMNDGKGNRVKNVHQLRVSIRRARAAIDLFVDVLPSKETKRTKRILKSLRKAAGDVRDMDVLFARLSKVAKQKHQFKKIAKKAARQREKAQKFLTNHIQHFVSTGFQACSTAVRWSKQTQEPTYKNAALQRFDPIINNFLVKAEDGFADVEALHQLRIAGKRLRYSMELCCSSFDESFRQDLYPIVARIQEKIGPITDRANAIQAFKEWGTQSDQKNRRVLNRLIAKEQQRLREEMQAFQKWLSPARIEELRHCYHRTLKTAEPLIC